LVGLLSIIVSLESRREEAAKFICSSAQQVLEEHFLAVLKDPSSKLHQHVSAIVTDEFHTVETWTEKNYLAYA